MNHHRGRNTRQQVFACFLINIENPPRPPQNCVYRGLLSLCLSRRIRVSSQGGMKRMDSMKDRIKAIRTHFALSQEQFGKRINKMTSFVSTVETGRCGLSPATFETICRVFGVNAEWLRTGNGPMFSTPATAVDKTIIGSRVKELRKEAGLTVSALPRCHNTPF